MTEDEYNFVCYLLGLSAEVVEAKGRPIGNNSTRGFISIHF